MAYLPFDCLHGGHVEVRVPAAVKQEAEIVHLQEVARRGLVVGPRQSRELDDGRHVSAARKARTVHLI